MDILKKDEKKVEYLELIDGFYGLLHSVRVRDSKE